MRNPFRHFNSSPEIIRPTRFAKLPSSRSVYTVETDALACQLNGVAVDDTGWT
jgi:hypothetical protein